MTQRAIPFLFMRGGSSRGPFFNAKDLPRNKEHLSNVLISALGSGHPLNIDGIGGGNPVTTKVAILSQSEDDWADIDYFFAQVSVETGQVDYRPTCGNILSAVGAAAIEMGLFTPENGKTTIKIRAVNTNAKIETIVETPNGRVTYMGTTKIDGVPNSHAPVLLKFMDVAGSSLGKMLPTGQLRDNIDGVDVTCLDVAMPMVIARAEDFGVTCEESAAELNANKVLFEKMESIRLKAGEKMGLRDVRASVTPKFGLLAPPRKNGSIAARYFMPWEAHPTMAVTGGQCLAACALMKGSIADGLMAEHKSPANVIIEHPLGIMEMITEYSPDPFKHISSGLIRTCRLLAKGELYIPHHIWIEE